jgi:multisubunit Na+/H+ antiporter MnhC subunit
VNWTALGLAITVIAIDVAFLLLYRSGFEVALGLNITQTAAALILVAIGVFVFREKITAVNVRGSPVHRRAVADKPSVSCGQAN